LESHLLPPFLSWYETIKNVKFEKKTVQLSHGILVGRVGLEPTRYRYRQILSLLRLPIPPPPHGDNSTRFRGWVKELQYIVAEN
jgi:hypothetical protein